MITKKYKKKLKRYKRRLQMYEERVRELIEDNGGLYQTANDLRNQLQEERSKMMTSPPVETARAKTEPETWVEINLDFINPDGSILRYTHYSDNPPKEYIDGEKAAICGGILSEVSNYTKDLNTLLVQALDSHKLVLFGDKEFMDEINKDGKDRICINLPKCDLFTIDLDRFRGARAYAKWVDVPEGFMCEYPIITKLDGADTIRVGLQQLEYCINPKTDYQPWWFAYGDQAKKIFGIR